MQPYPESDQITLSEKELARNNKHVGRAEEQHQWFIVALSDTFFTKYAKICISMQKDILKFSFP